MSDGKGKLRTDQLFKQKVVMLLLDTLGGSRGALSNSSASDNLGSQGGVVYSAGGWVWVRAGVRMRRCDCVRVCRGGCHKSEESDAHA